MNTEKFNSLSLEERIKHIVEEKYIEGGDNIIDLKYANFQDQNLVYLMLADCDLTGVIFTGSDLCGASFINCILTDANFKCANMRLVSFENCKMQNCKFDHATMTGTKFENCEGIPTQYEWIETNLERTENGWIAYAKSVKDKGALLEATLNTNRQDKFGCGVTVYSEPPKSPTCHKVLIPFASGICVPYNTKSRFRVERCILLEKVNE